MARIFISHRPGDAAGYVMALQEAVAARYGREHVRTFVDVARSDPGAPVPRLIERAVDEAEVVLAVIGSSWLGATDEAGRTVADEDDRIRRELERALASGKPVIPVPIGAQLPRREDLPASLQPLLSRNAVPISETSFDHGIARLTGDIDRIAAPPAAEPEPPPAPEPAYTPPPEPAEPSTVDWDAFQRMAELASLRMPARQDVSQRTKQLRGWFGVLGLAAGAAAGWYAHTRDDVDSKWLAVFIGLLVFQFVSRAPADVLTETKKLRRLLYFALTPALAALTFYYTYQWWETWWLSFVLGIVAGGILAASVGAILFPAIHREETADTRSRWKLST